MSKVVTISEAASIGLHAVVIIAKSDKFVNSQQIAVMTNSSKHHVAKILQLLARKKFLYSQRGSSGGFSLNKSPESITFLDIYEAIEGKLSITICPLNKPSCPFDHCIFGNVIQKMTRTLQKYLDSQTVADHM